jgi:hypothetical protein
VGLRLGSCGSAGSKIGFRLRLRVSQRMQRRTCVHGRWTDLQPLQRPRLREAMQTDQRSSLLHQPAAGRRRVRVEA